MRESTSGTISSLFQKSLTLFLWQGTSAAGCDSVAGRPAAVACGCDLQPTPALSQGEPHLYPSGPQVRIWGFVKEAENLSARSLSLPP